MEQTTISYDELLKMLQPDYDYDEHWEKYVEPVEEYFKQVITLEVPENLELFECGSYRPSDTPKCLYRILWLLGPSGVNFDDMYKCELFMFLSRDKRFAVEVALFKYELGLYFYAPKSAIDTSQMSFLQAGWPGANNGQTLTDEDGKKFFEIVKLAIEAEWCVYGGNNFEV